MGQTLTDQSKSIIVKKPRGVDKNKFEINHLSVDCRRDLLQSSLQEEQKDLNIPSRRPATDYYNYYAI